MDNSASSSSSWFISGKSPQNMKNEKKPKNKNKQGIDTNFKCEKKTNTRTVAHTHKTTAAPDSF